jgi:hypothetical protein
MTQRPILSASVAEAACNFVAGGVDYHVATLQDDQDLRAMLRENTMSSWVGMSFEREPSYFGAKDLVDDEITVIAHEDTPSRAPIGMYTCRVLPVHVNGQPERVSYFGGLRVTPKYRNRFHIVRNGFKSINKLISAKGTVPYRFTSVARENMIARRLLEARLPGMPVYSNVGELATLALSSTLGRKNKNLLRRATVSDIPALVEFVNNHNRGYQFSTFLTEAWFHQASRSRGIDISDFWVLVDSHDICACIAVWDQRTFKQTVVRSYSTPLRFLRRGYNLWAAIANRVPLPAVGQTLDQAYLSFVTIDDAVLDDCIEIIREALGCVRDNGARVGVLGLSPDNPMYEHINAALPAHEYRTCIEIVSWPNEPEPIIDGRPPQPEVALL